MHGRSLFAILVSVLSAGCGEDPPGNWNLGGSGIGATASGAGGAAGSAGRAGSQGAAGTGIGTGGSGQAGGSAGAAGGAAGAAGAMAAGDGAAGAGGATGAECQGFPLEGLMHSPGGNVLPNKCMPFDATTNNPYAVRCTDAWPWYKTKFPGDNYCILPPPPDKGIQYGVHPQGKEWYAKVSKGDLTGYDNLSSEWTMEPGEEEEQNYRTGITHAEAKFYRSHPRMRPGSHHMIVSTGDGALQQEVWGPGSPDGLFGGTSLPGSQRPDENTPKSLETPAEDTGLYAIVPANPSISFNMHHFNFTSQAILKEAWTNLWFENDGTTRVYSILGLDVLQVATMSIEPGTTVDLHYSWDITQPIRLVSVFGHRHAWTTNFSAWVEKPGGMLDIVYQSFDWFDEPTYRYDSQAQNPPPNPEARTDGASSGVRTLNPGETFHFNCHIEYTDERAQAEMAPSPTSIGTLRFANQAFTAEMCILFGQTAAVNLGAPGANLSPLPPFATFD
jgi:hypothetical protein